MQGAEITQLTKYASWFDCYAEQRRDEQSRETRKEVTSYSGESFHCLLAGWSSSGFWLNTVDRETIVSTC